MFLFSATAAAVIGCLSTQVGVHGYTLIPEAVLLAKHKKDKKISSWIVEIEPQFKADWNSVGNDDDLIARYVEKAKEGGYENDIRKLLDSDMNLYAADGGNSDPNTDSKTPPSDDDKIVLHDDDCEKPFGTADYMTQNSVLKPIDSSLCSTSGCLYRCYWIALQGSDNGYVWQIYKHCTGPPAGQASTATTGSGSAASNTTQTSTDAPAT
ncbi:hypothetical protein PC129_g22477 [Phytophthora cactorum]|uniref:Secreted protein n=1 Tax=Phytophthora cactorum TaxID=29920 RepID=A0A8T1JPL8_9STRA|nr:hypothetical protein PC112_g22519 [Phytophthora cactorum]KAG2821844.1 hypothetical protein PC113_g22414 [Phytophthora cactorum]KAG2825129.1 hypothetical protein PC111_g9513 [Phytophthora cactorum]KAG2908671.1 hypothetical protein PC114_g10373 [Phytophthora cactorum]KAG2924080.1 hypothetical protein PC115_g8747 [Phytophthora cactorum]